MTTGLYLFLGFITYIQLDEGVRWCATGQYLFITYIQLDSFGFWSGPSQRIYLVWDFGETFLGLHSILLYLLLKFHFGLLIIIRHIFIDLILTQFLITN